MSKLLKLSLQQWKVYILQIKFIKLLQKKSLSKAFKVWKNYSKRNWKLSIRAQVYAKLQSLKKNFQGLAVAHQNLVEEKRFLKAKSFVKWRDLQLQNQSLKLALKTRLLKAYFQRLQKAYIESNSISCQKRKFIFRKWNSNYYSKIVEKSNLLNAVKKSQISLISANFKKWILKFQFEIQKKLKIQKMQASSLQKVFKKFFLIWNNLKTFKEFKRNLEELADWTLEKNTKIRIFRLWRLNFSSFLKEKEILTIVQTMQTRKMMQEFVLRLKKKMLTQKYVVVSRELYTLKHYFMQLRQKCINKDLKRDQEECRLGILYFKAKVKEKFLKKWIKRNFAIKSKRVCQKLALKFSKTSSQRKLFTVWKDEWKKSKFESRMVIKAQRFSRKRILGYYMELWGNEWNMKIEICKKIEQAHEFYEYKLKQKGVDGFKDNLFKSLENYYFMESAAVNYNRLLAKNVLKGLKINVVNMQNRRKIINLAKSRNYKRTIMIFLWKWTLTYRQKNRENMIQEVVKFNYGIMQRQVYFKAWKEYVFAKHSFMNAVQAFEERLLKNKLTCCFLFWSDRATKIRNERELLSKAIEFRNSRLLQKIANIDRRRKDTITKRKSPHAYFYLFNLKDLCEKIINSWKNYCSEKLLKYEKMLTAQNFFSSRVFATRFWQWKKNVQHKKLDKQANHKAEQSTIKRSFKKWFEQKADWKEVYFNQKTKPKIVYHLNLKRKMVSTWKAFILDARLQKERLKDAIFERSKLILSETFRAWIKYAEQMKKFQNLRSNFLAKKYGNIWIGKIRRQKALIESCRRARKRRSLLIRSENPESSTTDLSSGRPAPRMPLFLADQFKHEASRQKLDGSTKILKGGTDPKVSIREFSCQTEYLPEIQEQFKRKDSAIDVGEADLKVDDDLNYGQLITLKQIAAGLFKYPKSDNNPIATSDLNHEKENFSKAPKMVHVMEQRLSEFQDSKKRHQKNLERLSFGQKDIDSILTNPKCHPTMLKQKIREIESLQKEITEYNQTHDSRKSEIIDLSQQISYLIQQTR